MYADKQRLIAVPAHRAVSDSFTLLLASIVHNAWTNAQVFSVVHSQEDGRQVTGDE